MDSGALQDTLFPRVLTMLVSRLASTTGLFKVKLAGPSVCAQAPVFSQDGLLPNRVDSVVALHQVFITLFLTHDVIGLLVSLLLGSRKLGCLLSMTVPVGGCTPVWVGQPLEARSGIERSSSCGAWRDLHCPRCRDPGAVLLGLGLRL